MTSRCVTCAGSSSGSEKEGQRGGKRGLGWQQAGPLFQRPRANVLVVIRGVDSLDLPKNITSYPLENV